MVGKNPLFEPFMFWLCCNVSNGKKKPNAKLNFLVFVMLQGEDGKRKPKLKLKFYCFGYNRKNSMLIGLHVFIVWTHYKHQGENLTSVCMCVGVCVILFIYFVVQVVDLCVYGNIVGYLQKKVIVSNSIIFCHRNVTLNYNLHNNG